MSVMTDQQLDTYPRNSKKISFIIPLYNEEPNIVWHHQKITKYLTNNSQDYEILYIDDGSSDKSLSIVRELRDKDKKHVRFVALSRNFGKEAATTAGIQHAKGDAVVIMDGDGQHPVELVETFVNLWAQGNDVIVGVRESNTNEGYVKKYGSRLFYRTLKFIGGREVVSGTTDFRLLDKKVVTEFNKLTERNRVTRNLIDWLGFSRTEVPFTASERHAGEAAYSFRKLLKLAIAGIVSHSTRPLKIIAVLGLAISAISALVGLFLAIQKYILGDPLGLSVTGSALIALFSSFLVGIVLVCQGLLALYLESVYYETQNRPLFVIKERN